MKKDLGQEMTKQQADAVVGVWGKEIRVENRNRGLRN